MPKSATRTIRVDPSLLKELKARAKQKGQSENSLIASLIENYVQVGAWTESIPVVMLRREQLISFFRHLTDSQVREIGLELGREVTPDSVRFMYHEVTPETFLKIMDIQSKYMRWGNYTMGWNGNVLEVFVKHEFGRKWSVFLEAYLGMEGANLLDSDFESHAAEAMVSLKFTPKSRAF